MLLGLYCHTTFCQDRINAGGFFPEAQLTYKVGTQLKLIGKIESQHGAVNHNLNREANWAYYYDRTDFQVFADVKLEPLMAFAAGYQYRWNGDGRNNHRAIQQVSLVQLRNKLRIGHRLRTDQTFDPVDSPEFRVRYRLLFEIPLEGSRIDPGEFYLIASDEAIFGTQGGEFKIENRLVCSLGHYFSKKQKLEGGIDYRSDDFLNGGLRQRFWFKVGWFVSI
jgi:hypothetical protein